jgi:hypothetical protein
VMFGGIKNPPSRTRDGEWSEAGPWKIHSEKQHGILQLFSIFSTLFPRVAALLSQAAFPGCLRNFQGRSLSGVSIRPDTDWHARGARLQGRDLVAS